MEPATKQPHRSKCGFESLCPRLLIAWLKSAKGQPLREALESELFQPNLAERLFDGSEESKQLQAEVMERADKTVRAMVTVQPTESGDVDVQVYGPRELMVKVITLPMVPPEPELNGLTERLVEVEAGKNYRTLLETGRMRARGILDRCNFHFWEWVAKEKEKIVRATFSDSITETMAEVFPELRKKPVVKKKADEVTK
jgi:hypothetical protein